MTREELQELIDLWPTATRSEGVAMLQQILVEFDRRLLELEDKKCSKKPRCN